MITQLMSSSLMGCCAMNGVLRRILTPGCQRLKYTMDNMLYYATYVHGISQYQWLNMKYADEVSFASRGMHFIVCAILVD
jgi:hypothetical protein